MSYCASCAAALLLAAVIVLPHDGRAQSAGTSLTLNDSAYFETRGVNILVFNNCYGMFNDEKLSGVEIIHHGVRTATNGDVRLQSTPAQWDSIPEVIHRTVDRANNAIEVTLRYPSYRFEYTIRAVSRDSGVVLSVQLSRPLPKELEGRAGLNLEFLPAAYFEKTFLVDGRSGLFPRYPASHMVHTGYGTIESAPLAEGQKLMLAPEDPERRIAIDASGARLALYDGRNIAQNGWYVVRTLIPSNRTGTVVEWFIGASTIPGWTRRPMIAYSQAGYVPAQQKTAVIEFDRNDTTTQAIAHLLKVDDDGRTEERYSAALKPWGAYLRYRYATFDFSEVTDSGVFLIDCDGVRTKPFCLDATVHEASWHPTLDVYFPVQMDHMRVREAYRIWHGAAHLDDALQAPPDHIHFDLYAQGSRTDSPYKPFEHIPGLNVGGWFDAGDYDIRTQTQYSVVSTLVDVWETFHITRDETTVDQTRRSAEIHRPDGIPDVIQQIEHGTLQLLAQYRAFGRAINGIVDGHLLQYTHLGDASTQTDNLLYNPHLDSLHSDGVTSGIFDDRWAFTNKSTPLNFGSIAALAAASRALRTYNDTLARQCLDVAVTVWKDEHTHAPDIFYYGNTTGGVLAHEELKAAVELLVCTKDPVYARRVRELVEANHHDFAMIASYAVRALPYMDKTYADTLETLTREYAAMIARLSAQNPFGVPITTTGWAGSGTVTASGIINYQLYKAFPAIVDPAYTLRCLNYLYGCHPGSNVSLVSGVGTVSKKIAYGNNRADFTFIAGGVVPGVLIVKPDFPENKDDWPFLWGENEYVINVGAGYLYLALAADDLLKTR